MIQFIGAALLVAVVLTLAVMYLRAVNELRGAETRIRQLNRDALAGVGHRQRADLLQSRLDACTAHNRHLREQLQTATSQPSNVFQFPFQGRR